MSDRLRIGIVGAGVFGGYHASKYAASEKSVLAGIYDTDPLRAAGLAQKFGVTPATSLSDLFERSDAIVIASPAASHSTVAEVALAANKHVFVEKPLALEMTAAERLVNQADQRGLVLQVGHQERYVASAFGLLDRAVSPIRVDFIRHTESSGRCGDVSVVFDLMVHDFDLARELTRSHPERVTAEGDENEVRADIILQNGATGAFSASRCAPSLERRVTLAYEDGVVEFDFIKREIVNTTPATLKQYCGEAEATSPLVDPLGYGAERFINSILHGEPVIVTGSDGMDAVAWACAVEGAGNIAVSEAQIAEERLLA